MTKSTVQKGNIMSVEGWSVQRVSEKYQQALDQHCVATLLTQRLSERHDNYERAAARLELRGEADAARVLRRAASRLRTITRQTG